MPRHPSRPTPPTVSFLAAAPALTAALLLLPVALGAASIAHAAADATFPRVMGFRASEADLLIYTGTSDFADVDIIHEIDAGVLRSVHPAGKPAIYHVAFASGKPIRCDNVFAGHWLYRAGTRAVARIDASATSITVEPGANFVENGDVVLYTRHSGSGEIDWSTAEHAEVDSVSGGTLTLARTTPVDWTTTGTGANRELVVAPHASMDGEVIEGNDLWAFNVSTLAPENAGVSGAKAAADCFVNGYWKNPDVLDSKASGVEFDSARWRFDATSNPPEDVDVDNDLAADYGIPGGEAAWGRGGMLYLEEIRAQLPGVTVQLDSSLPSTGWRAFTDVDGIEMENFPSADNWSRFSEALTHLSTWTDEARGDDAPFSYPVTKDDTLTYQCDIATSVAADIPEPVGDARFRLGLASALMVGAPHAYAAEDDTNGTKCFDLYPWPEYRGGNLGDHDWLGSPKGRAKRSKSDVRTVLALALDGDLLLGATASVSEHPDADEPADAYSIQSRAVSSDPLDMRLEVRSVPTREQTAEILDATSTYFPAVQGAWIEYAIAPLADQSRYDVEYTVEFEASAGVTSTTVSPNSARRVPRLLRVKLNGAVDGTPTTWRQDVLVPIGGRHTFSLTFRVPANSDLTAPAPARLRFESGEETGWVRVRPHLYAGSAERWSRRFSNGLVLLNRSDEDWTVTLPKQGAKHGYCVIQSAGGASVEASPTVQVPADDALFLVKRPGTKTPLACP